MKFQKNISREVRELLTEQLKEYELETTMTGSERKQLYEWVASGHSPYDSGDYACRAGGYPLDFISALHFWKDLQEWYDGLSEEEKRAEREGYPIAAYDPETDEPFVDMSEYGFSMETDELPFQ